MFFGFLSGQRGRDTLLTQCRALGLSPMRQDVQFWADDVNDTEGGYVAVRGRPVASADGQPLSAVDLAASYRRRGEDMFEELAGPFAIAVYDSVARKLVLAVDRMGIERVTYRSEGDGVVFGRDARQVAGTGAQIDDQRLFDFVFFHMVPAPHTVYEGVYKLPPASLLIAEGGDVRVRRYWEPTYDYDSDARGLKQELPKRLEQAVRSVGPDDRTGAFLSGGLDSSTVAGCLSRVSDGPARTFSIGFDVAGYDELSYARIANRHFGCIGTEYKVTAEDIVASFGQIAAAYDEPFGNSSVVPTFYCAKVAKAHGVRHLLAGDGGDELFAGNERYATQKLFERYFLLPSLLRRGVMEPLARRIRSERQASLLRRFRGYVNQALTPLPERLEVWNFTYRESVASYLDPDFASAVDTSYPIQLMAEVYDQCSSQDTTDRLQEYDWRFTLADSDLRKVTTMCELAGVRVSFPMLDHAVVDLSVRIPPRDKLPGLKLRHFYKEAMRDFLPPEIIAKSKHGFGLPFGQWLKTHDDLQELIFSNLSDFKQRHVFRPEFIDRIIAEQRGGHAPYYGYFIWDLAMLEQWLKYR